MGITFRHDAAAIVPSNKSNRKYGMQLVQQQQRYAQAEKDRQYGAQRQQAMNEFTLLRDEQRRLDNLNRQQMGFDLAEQQRLARDKTEDQRWNERRKLQMQDRNQERERMQIQQARDQLAAMARERLDRGDVPDEIVPELRKALAGRMAMMADPSYDAAQRQEYMDGWNAQVAGYLSQSKPRMTAQERFNQRPIAVDPETGEKWLEVSPGDFVPMPKMEAEQQPVTTREVFQADPKTRQEFMDYALNELTEGGMKASPGFDKVLSRAMELHGMLNGTPQATPTPSTSPAPPAPNQATPTPAPPLQGGYVPPGLENVFESPAQENNWAFTDEAKPNQPTQERRGYVPPGLESAFKPQAPVETPRGEMSPMPPALDLDKSLANATSERDKTLIKALKGKISDDVSPSIKSALAIVLDANTGKDQKISASRFLAQSGFDLNEVVGEEMRQRVKGTPDEKRARRMLDTSNRMHTLSGRKF